LTDKDRGCSAIVVENVRIRVSNDSVVAVVSNEQVVVEIVIGETDWAVEASGSGAVSNGLSVWLSDEDRRDVFYGIVVSNNSVVEVVSNIQSLVGVNDGIERAVEEGSNSVVVVNGRSSDNTFDLFSKTSGGVVAEP